MRDGDDVLTAYVLSIADEAGYPIPDSERKRMEQALIGFVEGRIVRYSRAADGRSRDPQGRGARSAVAPRGAAQREVARQLHHRAQPVADVGGDRLVPDPQAPAEAAAPRRALRGSRAGPALAPEFPGHDDELLAPRSATRCGGS